MTQTLNIVVTGVVGAGRSTLIQSVSEIDLITTDLDHEHLPLPLEVGRLTVADDLIVHLIETPGTRGLDPHEFPFLEHTLGIVLVVDSADPANFIPARAIIHALRHGRKPFIVAANKQDQPEAYPLEKLRHALHLTPDIKLVPCTARDPESAKAVFRALIYRLFNLD